MPWLMQNNAGRRWRAARRVPTGCLSMPCGRPGSIAGRVARSRQPRRENVAFYATPAAAEAAGFRPCKRCRPNEASAGARHVAAIGRACALDPRARHTADPRRTGGRRRHQPLSFSSRLQGDHRRDAARMGQGASARPLRRSARCRRKRRRCGLCRRLRRQLARLRGGAERPRHDARSAAARRARRDHPLHDGRDRARLGLGRRDRARHLHDRARRRAMLPSKPNCAGASRPR